jgi:hypothetical protein
MRPYLQFAGGRHSNRLIATHELTAKAAAHEAHPALALIRPLVYIVAAHEQSAAQLLGTVSYEPAPAIKTARRGQACRAVDRPSHAGRQSRQSYRAGGSGSEATILSPVAAEALASS